MSIITDILDKPPHLPDSSRFTILNGIFYLAFGALMMIWPESVQKLLFEPEFVGREAALIRIMGMMLAIIGWFYFFGGRSGARQIVAASVLDRIILVPLVLVPLAISGVFPNMLMLFAVLDPIMGLIAWYLLNREKPQITIDESK